MLNLRGEKIYLRALEPTDLEFLYELENNTDIWEISGTVTPYSKHILKLYLKNTHKDIYEVKQLRLCICRYADHAVLGLIDIFDFDASNRRAGIGIVILENENRNQGFGSEAVSVLCRYAFGTLGLRQLYANVLEENPRSIKMFNKLKFEKVGVKKDWIYSGNKFKNEVLMQRLNS